MSPYLWTVFIISVILIGILVCIICNKRKNHQDDSAVNYDSTQVGVSGTKASMKIEIDGTYEFVAENGKITECRDKKTGKIIIK